MFPMPSLLLASAALIGGGGGTYTSLDPADKFAGITLSNGDLTATKDTTTNSAIVQALHGKATGKWMFEVTITTPGGTGEIGVGICGAGGDPINYPGESGSRSVGYNSNNGVILNGSGSQGGSTSFTKTAGDVLSVYVDADVGKVWFARNGTIATTASSPSAGTGGINISAFSKALYPVINLVAPSSVVTSNFGSSAFSYPVSGFNGWTAVAAATDMTTFRAVRMAPRSRGYFSHSVAEFELLTSAGGSTIFSGGTPGGSGATTGGSASNMVDGNTTTHFDQGFTGNQNQANVWFGYDFGSSGTRNVTHIALRSRDGGGGNQLQCPTQVNLYTSTDNTVFWKVKTGVNFAAWGANTPGDRQVVAL